ncbi:hypothetical protein RclHR1_02810001 [Rhizophagus clarus]|uniref:Uncharacterized protein n=1 Tax=Rhizophagus clarus TaxID=94130 RepID=A0A2Z6R2Y9_9GLOM|nr:hypothetical protein RclHR1_02810001 [Rhizophagus clarus]
MLYKLVVLGDGGVGKCALTIQLCLNHFVVVIDDQPCVLEVLDTAGQEEYTALRDQWIRDGEGFLLVYSISSRSTFERVERFRDQITRVKDTDNVPLMLVGNKCDKITEREVSREEGMNMARKLNCEFIESSAKTCVNVERAFYTVVRMIRANRGYEYRKKKKRINIRIKKPKRPNPIIFLRKKKKIFSRLLS